MEMELELVQVPLLLQVLLEAPRQALRQAPVLVAAVLLYMVNVEVSAGQGLLAVHLAQPVSFSHPKLAIRFIILWLGIYSNAYYSQCLT